MDETGKGITRQHVIKHYMLARATSFKEKTIVSAWKRSGLSPLNPEVFTQRDFGPSVTTSIKPLFPASFQSLLDDGPESDTGAGEEIGKDEDMIVVPSDWSPESNCGPVASDNEPGTKDLRRHNDLPILDQAATNNTSDVPHPEPSFPVSSTLPPSAPPQQPQQLIPDVQEASSVPSEEGGESPSELGD